MWYIIVIIIIIILNLFIIILLTLKILDDIQELYPNPPIVPPPTSPPIVPLPTPSLFSTVSHRIYGQNHRTQFAFVPAQEFYLPVYYHMGHHALSQSHHRRYGVYARQKQFRFCHAAVENNEGAILQRIFHTTVRHVPRSLYERQRFHHLPH